jgi:uncharacterized NAD-dependent epimerase/dehydratase family protein
LILADGELGVFTAKTATSLIRYRPDEVVGVLDQEHAGRTTREVLGVPAAVPIVGTLEEGLALRPDTLLIGIAPQGGQLPEPWRVIIRDSLRAGLSVVSGLHVFLGDDPEFVGMARVHGQTLLDLRRPPADQPIASMQARNTRALRLLTVGTDCNVGKMVAALELAASARRRDLDGRFLATGQTGMMISGGGVTLDRIPGDFMAGFVEKLVTDAGDAEIAIIEGQGCLLHPAYSSVTLALLHGALPDAMVLVHHAARKQLRYQDLDIPPLTDWIRRYEDAVAPLHPGKVVGIAINPYGLSPEDAAAAIRRAEDETGLPAVDVVTEGADRLLDAVLQRRQEVS